MDDPPIYIVGTPEDSEENRAHAREALGRVPPFPAAEPDSRASGCDACGGKMFLPPHTAEMEDTLTGTGTEYQKICLICYVFVRQLMARQGVDVKVIFDDTPIPDE